MQYKDKSWLHRKYIEENLTTAQISTILGVSPSTIQNWLAKFGIPRRKRGVPYWSEEQKEYRRRWNRVHPEINRMRGRKHSDETKLKMSLSRRGIGNANWKGGLTALVRGIRRSPEYYQWRKDILERDKHTCQDCKAGDNLDAHHIRSIMEHPEGIFDVSNGLTICRECHDRHTWWQKMRPKSKRRKAK